MDEITKWSKLSTQNLQNPSCLWFDAQAFCQTKSNLCIKKNHQIKNIGVLELHNVIAPN